MPQKADHYILGIDGDLFEHLRFSSQVYYKKYSNLLGYNLDKIDASDPDFSSGTGVAYGFENMIKLQIERFYLWASYALSKAEKTINGITYAPLYDKRHSVNLLGGYSFQKDLTVSFNWEFSTGSPFTQIVGYMDREKYEDIFNNGNVISEGNPFAIFGEKNKARLPSYHRLDLTISKTFYISNLSKLNVDFSVINLYDVKNIFYYNRESGERINMLPFMPSVTIGVEF
jgi:outer membrane receptor protein involved in Fe transport